MWASRSVRQPSSDDGHRINSASSRAKISDFRPETGVNPLAYGGLRRSAAGPIIEGMKYLHTMVRVSNLEASLEFYVGKLGLREIRRVENTKGRFTLVFLAAPGNESAQVELTYNWDPETLSGGRNFGHLAYSVDDIYATCARLQANGVIINRPPRDGHMAFIRSPDKISIELLQAGDALPPAEPWLSMPNVGEW